MLTLAKRLNQTLEELQGTINATAKHTRTAVEDMRGVDDRISAMAKIAQEALHQSSGLAARKPEVNLNEVSRQHLERTAVDIRLEPKSLFETCSKEMESMAVELRGTVSALSLQMECGLSGSTTVLGDVLESTAKKHVDHLEWLKALDGHRSQMEMQQSELEARLSALLKSHKVALQADLEAIGMQVKEHQRFQSSIAELSTGLAQIRMEYGTLNSGISGLETHLKSRVTEWESFSKTMHDRVHSLGVAVAENKSNVAAIAGAISTISGS